jgi:hypothetical protein
MRHFTLVIRHLYRNSDITLTDPESKEPWIEGSGNIYKDLGFDDEEAANLLARATLLLQKYVPASSN